MGLNSGTVHARFADAVSLIVKKPRTAGELADLIGLHVSAVGRLLKALRNEGLVTRHVPPSTFGGGRQAAVYTWAPRALPVPITFPTHGEHAYTCKYRYATKSLS